MWIMGCRLGEVIKPSFQVFEYRTGFASDDERTSHRSFDANYFFHLPKCGLLPWRFSFDGEEPASITS